MPEIPLSWHRLQWLTLGTARFGAVSILAPHDAEDPLVRAIHRLAANPLGRGIPHHHVYELERLAYLGRVFASSKPFQSRADRMKRSGLISCGGQADDARDRTHVARRRLLPSIQRLTTYVASAGNVKG